jgi:hypothetical protein
MYQSRAQFEKAKELIMADRVMTNAVIVESISYYPEEFIIAWKAYDTKIVKAMCAERNLIPIRTLESWIPGTPFPPETTRPRGDPSRFSEFEPLIFDAADSRGRLLVRGSPATISWHADRV